MTNQTTSTTQPNLLQKGQTMLQNGGAAAYDGASNFLGKAGDWFKKNTENLGPWQIAGMAAGGLLAWTIGNAFGGGGILGMVISAMLALYMVDAGRNMFSSFDTGRQAAAQPGLQIARSGPEHLRQHQRNYLPEDSRYNRRPRANDYSSLEEQAPPQALAEARDAAAPARSAELVDGPLPLARPSRQSQIG